MFNVKFLGKKKKGLEVYVIVYLRLLWVLKLIFKIN